MQSATQTVSVSKKGLWSGRIISALAVLFLTFDAVAKLMKAAAVLQVSARLEIPETLVIGIGIILLVCTVVYVIPRTSVLGANQRCSASSSGGRTADVIVYDFRLRPKRP